MAGKFRKFCLKTLFVSCAFIARVAEASADHKSTNEDFNEENKNFKFEKRHVSATPVPSSSL